MSAVEIITVTIKNAILRLGKDVSDLSELVPDVLSYSAEIRLTAKMAIQPAKHVSRFIVENIIGERNEPLAEWVIPGKLLDRVQS